MKNISKELRRLEVLVGEKELRAIRGITLHANIRLADIFEQYNTAVNEITCHTSEVVNLLKAIEVKLFGSSMLQIIHYGPKQYFNMI